MKRNLFDELSEGFDTLAKEREGKMTLKTHKVEQAPLSVEAAELIALREKLRMSQAVFATLFRIKTRTYQNWEQGRGKPNEQAALLFRLVERKPEIINELRELEEAGTTTARR
jgi:putative transcriptional regulator